MNPEDGGSDLRRRVDSYLPFDAAMAAKSSVIFSATMIDGSFDHIERKLWKLKNKNQLDATYYFTVLLIGSTCFGHYYAHHQ